MSDIKSKAPKNLKSPKAGGDGTLPPPLNSGLIKGIGFVKYWKMKEDVVRTIFKGFCIINFKEISIKKFKPKMYNCIFILLLNYTYYLI